MKIFEITDLCKRFVRNQDTYDHARLYVAVRILELDPYQFRALAEHIAKFDQEDGSNV